jgi:hypothetical protein
VTIAGLSEGNHTVSVQLPGYENMSETITITAGQTGRFPVVLREIHTLSLMDIILAAGVILMIIVIGMVVMFREDTKK